jgi:hypothetical protein
MHTCRTSSARKPIAAAYQVCTQQLLTTQDAALTEHVASAFSFHFLESIQEIDQVVANLF